MRKFSLSTTVVYGTDPGMLEQKRLETLLWMRSEIQRVKDALESVAVREWGAGTGASGCG